MKIKQTRNYADFVQHITNRPITEQDVSKLKKLRASMKKYGFLPFPMLVRREGGKLCILDGQHRFAVAQELGLAVMWVETDRSDIVIAETAAGQTPWLLFHYVASYAKQGNEDYLKLQEFSIETGLPLSQAATLLAGDAHRSGAVADSIRDNRFRILDFDFARRVASITNTAQRHATWAMHRLSISAIARFARVPDFQDAHMIKKIEAHPHLLRRCPTLEMFSEMYEEVYNYMARSRVPLAFMAREVASQRMAEHGFTGQKRVA